MTQEEDEGQRWKWVPLSCIWAAVPCSYDRPSLAPWNITYYFSLMSRCLSHRDEWMQWHLMEEGGKKTKGEPRDGDDTEHLLLTFQIFFSSVRAPGCSQFSLTYSFILYIWHRCVCELCVALAIPISCLMGKRQLQSHLFPSFTSLAVESHNLNLPCVFFSFFFFHIRSQRINFKIKLLLSSPFRSFYRSTLHW